MPVFYLNNISSFKRCVICILQIGKLSLKGTRYMPKITHFLKNTHEVFSTLTLPFELSLFCLCLVSSFLNLIVSGMVARNTYDSHR